MDVCVPFVFLVPVGTEDNIRGPGMGVTKIVSHYMCTEKLNLGPLEEQAVLLTAEPFFHSKLFPLVRKYLLSRMT